MNTIDIENLIDPDNLAVDIADKWRLWHQEEQCGLPVKVSTTTANAILPWSNTTTTPKITQIADNLHANYFATLFPQQKWHQHHPLDFFQRFWSIAYHRCHRF